MLAEKIGKRWTINESKDVKDDKRKADFCSYYREYLHCNNFTTADIRAWVEANRDRWNEEKPRWWTYEWQREDVLACARLGGGEGEA